MDWTAEKCNICETWKAIGTKDNPNAFRFLWQLEDGKTVCPACRPKPEINTLRYTMRSMFAFPVMSEPGVFIDVTV